MHDVLPILRGEHLLKVDIPPFNDAALRGAAHTLLEPSEKAFRYHDSYMNKFRLCKSSDTSVCPNYNQLSDHSRMYARQYIGVQARLGVGTHEYSTVRFKGLRSKEGLIARFFARAVRRISFDLVGDAHAHVFLATDTPSFRHVFRSAMQASLPGSTVFWIDQPVRHYAGLPAGHKQGLEYFEHLFAEIRLLGDAAHILSFESGFSYSANWIGNALQLHTLAYHECGVE